MPNTIKFQGDVTFYENNSIFFKGRILICDGLMVDRTVHKAALQICLQQHWEFVPIENERHGSKVTEVWFGVNCEASELRNKEETARALWNSTSKEVVRFKKMLEAIKNAA